MDVQNCAIIVVKKLVNAGYVAYFAGGWVRDFLMGHPSADIDIATNAPPEKIITLFPKTLQVGARFGVVVVIVDNHQFEVSTFRKDMDYIDGRRPSAIALSTPEEDAQRRDFTINGMFYDPLEEKVIDFVQGQDDLEKGWIRTIGCPRERIQEDRLRMIRAVRFSVRFGFAIDPETRRAIKEKSSSLFPAVAIERIWQELMKMAKNPRFDQAIVDMHQLRLLQVIFPDLSSLSIEDVRRRVASFANMPKNCPTILYVMELFRESTLEQQRTLCHYLKVSNKNINIMDFTYQARQLIDKDKQHKREDVQWAHLYAHPDAQLCLTVIAARYSSKERKVFCRKQRQRWQRLQAHVEKIRSAHPLVTAGDLEKQGILPGEKMGALLKEAERVAVNRDLQNNDTVIAILKTSPLWPKKS